MNLQLQKLNNFNFKIVKKGKGNAIICSQIRKYHHFYIP